MWPVPVVRGSSGCTWKGANLGGGIDKSTTERVVSPAAKGGRAPSRLFLGGVWQHVDEDQNWPGEEGREHSNTSKVVTPPVLVFFLPHAKLLA